MRMVFAPHSCGQWYNSQIMLSKDYSSAAGVSEAVSQVDNSKYTQDLRLLMALRGCD